MRIGSIVVIFFEEFTLLLDVVVGPKVLEQSKRLARRGDFLLPTAQALPAPAPSDALLHDLLLGSLGVEPEGEGMEIQTPHASKNCIGSR